MACTRRQRVERELVDRRRLSNLLTPLDEHVRERIRLDGPLRYADVVELALYDPDSGFYIRGGQAGRRGDFLTSPEVGPLFGQLVANALDTEWDRLGQPEVFTIVDYGAGPGTLARSVAAATPRCFRSLRYVAVERSVEQRAQHPEWVLSADDLHHEVVGDGLTGVVIANELLDNLAFTPVSRVDGELRELHVEISGAGLIATPGAVLPSAQAALFDESLDSGVLQAEAATWLTRTLEHMSSGLVIAIDYARLASEDVHIRTYADHAEAGDPLELLGTKDITVDVDLAQLQRAVRPATAISAQADWLESHGLAALVEEGRRLWEAGASLGSLEALKARSRIREAEALTERSGLGGFTVAEWIVA